MLKKGKIIFIWALVIFLIKYGYNTVSDFVLKNREKFYVVNTNKNKKVLNQLLDTIECRAKAKLFEYDKYSIMPKTSWEIDTFSYANKDNSKIFFYVLQSNCESTGCSSEIITHKAEKINNRYYFTTGEAIDPVPSDYNWPKNKPMPFSMLSMITRNDRLPVYLKQKHWWNPFDFEINEDLFEYNFPMTGKSDEEKIKYYTKDWAFGERQPR